jgi:hypothetical protein
MGVRGARDCCERRREARDHRPDEGTGPAPDDAPHDRLAWPAPDRLDRLGRLVDDVRSDLPGGRDHVTVGILYDDLEACAGLAERGQDRPQAGGREPFAGLDLARDDLPGPDRG